MKLHLREVLVTDFNTPALEEVKPLVKSLYVFGNLDWLSCKRVGIVGTRSATAYGLKSSFEIAYDLSKKGTVIISGLARGIDGAAHRGALKGGSPTVAVLAHGLDQVYPVEHRKLAQEIVEAGGCLISEYPLTTPPQRKHFPLRNRIIAALSESVLVVEARKKSGSLITAQFALDLGKDVHVVPGRIDDYGFLGGLELIQQGASLFARTSDLMTKFRAVSPTSKVLELFIANGGLASLSELFDATELTLPEIEKELQEWVEKGVLVEVYPQQFALLENGDCFKRQRTETCQMANFSEQ